MNRIRFFGWAAFLALLATGLQAKTNTVTFDELPLTSDAFWNGSDLSGGFSSQGVFFSNNYNAAWAAWSGFSYSRVNDTNTAGFMNQFAAFGGTGFGGSGNYAVAWDDQWGVEADIITFPAPCKVKGLYVNNTTYVALTMLLGDAFSKKFGGVSGSETDWLLLTMEGKDAEGNTVGSKSISLADYRSPLSSEDHVLRDWTWVDLTSLGSKVKQLRFMMTSTDTSPWG
ncbi:MAG: DUF4465 domain-containing protein, partial [Lentisphaerota bacterium]